MAHMTAVDSDPALLVLHGVRLAGMSDASAIATRWGLPPADVHELLLDDEARGWVRKVEELAGIRGWWLTDAGRAEGERRLAAELGATGRRDTVSTAYAVFLELNARLLRACTDWQLRPTPWDRFAANDHADWSWDERVLKELTALGERMGPVCSELTGVLTRFRGYDERFVAALRRVDLGDRSWVDRPGADSCHTVWFQLHEDLLATLGIQRGEEGQ
jgi:hypothetical protein